MEKHIFTKELFNEYVKTRNYSVKKHNGYFIQERNNFFIAINTQFYEKFKQSLINRKADIITESQKIINIKLKTKRNFLYINCKNGACKKSIKALFKKYDLMKRRKKVLSPESKE